MALAFVGFDVTFSLAGAYDGTRTKTIEFVPAGADIAAQRAQLDNDIVTWLTAFNANNARTSGVSSAWVTGFTISNKYAETSAMPAFVGHENVYQEAQLQSPLNDKNVRHSIYIPSPASRIFVGDSVNTNRIDTTDADYQTYGALFVTGDGICAVSDGDAFEAPLNVTASALRTVRSGKRY